MSPRRHRQPIRRRVLLKLIGLAGPALLLGPGLTVRTVAAAPALQAASAEDDPYRLPRMVVPERYALTLAPDLDGAGFTGEVSISIQVREPVQEVVLNAADLEIAEAYLLDATMARLDGTVALQPDRERARIGFGRVVPAGPATLFLRFTGPFNEQLRGLYLATSEGSDGVTRVMATTQFESTDARRAFPCWDEPDFKATFNVSLVVDSGLTAISNGALLSETPRDDGKVALVFASSPKMSTYLVALSVGPLAVTEPLMVDGTPLRVAQLAAQPELDEVALEVGAFSLRYFNDYFGIPYPGGKLDFVAVPDFAAGAMENFGAISFNEAALLVDGETASAADLQQVALTVAHEISHQWFGNLVTMRWWNGLWLNEAFATMMETLAVDAYKPEWQIWVDFGFSRAGAMEVDALASTRPIEFPVHAPSEAEEMFDTITYQKGGSVLRMLEQHLGPAAFQRGVQAHLRAHSFGNAETTDLWEAIESATGQPTRVLMDTWVFQPGFPVVSVEVDGSGRRLTLSQRRFMYLPDGAVAGTGWQIPVTLRFGGQSRSEDRRVLLTGDTTTVDLPEGAAWVVANAGGHGFYRVRYAPDLLRKLTADVQQNLDTIERFNLLSDTWASVVAGLTPVGEYLDLARVFRDEKDLTAWVTLLDPFSALIRIAPADLRPAIHAFVRDLLRPPTDRLGWAAQPGEPEGTGRLRAILQNRLAVYGDDPAAQAKLRELHVAYLQDHAAVDPDLVPAAIEVTAHTGGAADFDLFLARYKSAPTPQERNQYLSALPRFRARDLIRRALALTLTDEIRTAQAPRLIGNLLRSAEGGDLAWDFIKAHWDDLLERFAPANIPNMLEGISALATPELAADVEQFFASHRVEVGARSLEQALEWQRINVGLRQREAANLAAYFH